MHDLRIGDHALQPTRIRPLTAEEWAAVHTTARPEVEDHLYFQQGEQIYDAVFDACTKLNAILRQAIDARRFTLTYNGHVARLLMVEDVESASMLSDSPRPLQAHDWPPINPQP